MTDEAFSTSSPQRVRNLVLPWRWISIGLAIVAVASLVSLVIVASTEHSGALVTVALSLALVAIAAQLVLTLAQSHVASGQLRGSRDLNSATRTILVEVRATADSILATLRGQFDVALSHALRRTVPDAMKEVAVSGNLTGPELEARFENALLRSFAAWSPTRLLTGQPGRERPVSAEDEAIAKQMASYPGQSEGKVFLEILRRLSPFAVDSLKSKADQEIEARLYGRLVGNWLRRDGAPVTEELIRHGLAEKIDPPARAGNAAGRDYAVLTPLGRNVARLLVPRLPMPGWLLNLVGERPGGVRR